MSAIVGTILPAAHNWGNWVVIARSIDGCVFAFQSVSSVEIGCIKATVFIVMLTGACLSCGASYKPFASIETNTVEVTRNFRGQSRHTDIEMATAGGGKRTSSARVYRRLSMGKCAGCLVDNVSLGGRNGMTNVYCALRHVEQEYLMECYIPR